MPEHHRDSDLPREGKWLKSMIGDLGFSVVVCVWLLYQNWALSKSNTSLGENSIRAVGEVKEAVTSLTTSVDQLNKNLRHIRSSRDRDE